MNRTALIDGKWAVVDMNIARENFKAVRKRLGNARICCVVKADAYGHGAVRMARLYETLGADFLAVSDFDEATELRLEGIEAPILILGYTDPVFAAELAAQNLSQCVFSATYAKALADAARAVGARLRVHLKIDTGMGRLGFVWRDETDHELNGVDALFADGTLIPEGVFTHFSSASEAEGEDFTCRQLDAFLGAVAYLETRGVRFSIRHAANSAAVDRFPESVLDMARVGIALYGHGCTGALAGAVRPILQLETTVMHIRDVRAGDSVGYGRALIAERDMRIAILPIGYADGLWRSNGRTGGCVGLRGQTAPIVGSVCMDQCMVDVSAIDGVRIGDTVTVYGTSPDCSVEAVAARNGTVPYELLCAIGQRVSRKYDDNGELSK